jgi:diguanylate cyclase (GGDEF)-like protein
VFPLAAIALHAKRRGWIAGGFAVSVALQAWTLGHDDPDVASFVTDISVAIAAALLTVFLARKARWNYLLAMGEARTDALTRVANRRAVEDAIVEEAGRCERYGGAFCLALLDVDGFKDLNDARGHGAGDAALRLLADVLTRRVRRTDLVARLGGDEFVVLMRGVNAAEGRVACDLIGQTVRDRMAQAGFALTVSIGCKSFIEAPKTALEALKIADGLLYQAKHRGKNCVVFA